MRPLKRTAIVLTFSLLIAAWELTSMTSVSAHAQIVNVDPADHSAVNTLGQIRITLDQEPQVADTVITITDASNDNIAQGNPSIRGTTLSQPITPDSPAGTYTIAWRITSADGDPVTGTSTVTIANGADALTAPADPKAAMRLADDSAGLGTMTVVFIALLFIGGILLLAVTRRHRLSRDSDPPKRP